jgi:hypothetical protein
LGELAHGNLGEISLNGIVRNAWFGFAEAAATDPSMISPAPTAISNLLFIAKLHLEVGTASLRLVRQTLVATVRSDLAI